MRRLVPLVVLCGVLGTMLAAPPASARPEGCSIRSTGTGWTLLFPTALNPYGLHYAGTGSDDVNVHKCKYRATRQGGYMASGTWTIKIENGSTTVVRNYATAAPCANTGFIQPGDVVTLSIRTALGVTTYDTALAAGPEVTC